METSRMMPVDSAAADSLSPIEFDTESKSSQATYDSDRDSTSLAVVAVVATALDRDLDDLVPIQSVIDTDSLDKLAAEASTSIGSCDRISFPYEGLEVTVTSEEVIKTTPIENP